jgi:hypothetical protein
MKPGTASWTDKTKVNFAYHERQFKEPYRSTVAFCNWIETLGLINSGSRLNILDLCSGAGANIYYMSQRYPKSSFTGVDINNDLVEQGNAFFQNNGIRKCCLEVGDIYNLDVKYVSMYEGVVSFQTVSWLPDFRAPFLAMANLAPQWIAITSLFYDGYVSCATEITEYDDALEIHREHFYNVYSLPVVKQYIHSIGYPSIQVSPFEIDIDLPKPTSTLMTTHTKKLEDGHRLQISGPLLMPWYFIAASK